MKKHIYTSIIVVLFSAAINSQSLKKADKLFSLKAYSNAAEIYETYPRSAKVLKNLADSYYYNMEMEKAVKSYRELFSKFGKNLDKEYSFRFAQALKGIKSYEEADKYLSNYFDTSINTILFMEELEKLTPHIFELEELKNIGSGENFGLTFLNKNEVSFASTRSDKNPKYAWNDLPYLNLYRAQINENYDLENIKPFNDQINTKSHESNAVFSRDGKTMYFNRTRTIRTKTSTAKIAYVNIYRAELIDGEWKNITSLPFNSDSYNTEHPALSKDGKTLYFSSDMPGSVGSFDIYKVSVEDNKKYGKPENLGPIVNTVRREQFPFISSANVLYFSSNGHNGFGGLDVFRSESNNEKTFKNPVNLGTSINSNLDDFAYIIDELNDVGFISSNRYGKDNIYKVKRKKNILTEFIVEGIVQDKNSKAVLPGSLVSLSNDQGEVISDSIVGPDASYSFKIEPNKNYKIRGTRKLYIPYDVKFSTDSDGKITHNVLLNLESYADAESKIKENEKGEVYVKLDKIYFDFDKSEIRPDAAAILETIIDLLNKYPNMEIEIAAHTDARGDEQYNLDLSKRRAKSALDYIVNNGISRSRLRSIGYGEMQPLNQCSINNNCSEEEHDTNRRCEFKVLK